LFLYLAKEKLRAQRGVACRVCLHGADLVRRSNTQVYGIPSAYLKDLYGMKKDVVSNWKKLQTTDEPNPHADHAAFMQCLRSVSEGSGK
jgi:hypothetical protein